MQGRINRLDHFLLNFRFLVNKTGYQDQEMAERLGIHKVSFSRYFTEKRIPKRTVLEKIASYFNVSTIDLIDKDLTQEHEKPAEPIRQIQDLQAISADIPPEFQKILADKLAKLQQQINNTVCELLNEFANLKKQ